MKLAALTLLGPALVMYVTAPYWMQDFDITKSSGIPVARYNAFHGYGHGCIYRSKQANACRNRGIIVEMGPR